MDEINKNFRVNFDNGSVGFFKCLGCDENYLWNNTFGFIVRRDICELLPEWAQ